MRSLWQLWPFRRAVLTGRRASAIAPAWRWCHAAHDGQSGPKLGKVGNGAKRRLLGRRAERALGQTPYASIVSCADSRVAPELIFDEGPGDLFVVRIAGNFVNEDGLASLEFGSAVLGSRLIMVLGHTACGAIQATIDVVQKGTELPGHLPSLATALRPGVGRRLKARRPAGSRTRRERPCERGVSQTASRSSLTSWRAGSSNIVEASTTSPPARAAMV
jgi:carbonic anhydrase